MEVKKITTLHVLVTCWESPVFFWRQSLAYRIILFVDREILFTRTAVRLEPGASISVKKREVEI